MDVPLKCCPQCIAEAQCSRAQLRVEMARENVAAMAEYYPFTPVEKQIAVLAVEGLSNAAIAEKRGTGEQVVRNYMKAIFDITGMSNRAELQALFTLGRVPPGKIYREGKRRPGRKS